MSSCSKRGDLTLVEHRVDSLITQSLHMHKAEYIEVMLVDSEGVIMADRQGRWHEGKGSYSFRSAKDKEIRPGQLLFPVLALACMSERCIDPNVVVTVGAKKYADCQVIDNQIKQDCYGKIEDSLPLCAAIYSSVAIIDLCRACFPTIEELRSSVIHYLPGTKIKENDYMKLCQGEGKIEVSKKEIVDFVRKYYKELQFNDGLRSLCYKSVQIDKKSKSIREYCLLCTENGTCLVVFKNTYIPGALQLANEIIKIHDK